MPNTALKLANGRQYSLHGEQTITFANIADTGVAVQALKLPFGAVVTGGEVVVDTPWNAGTSATLQVGDSTTANRYLGATSIQAAGRTALVPTGYVSDGSDITVTPTIAGTAPTAGSLRLRVTYTITGRAHEVQTN